MGNVTLTSLGLGSADLTAIGKLSEKGMTPDEVADGIEKSHSLQSSASEIDEGIYLNSFKKGGKPVLNFADIGGWSYGDTGVPVGSNIVDIDNVFSDITLEVVSSVAGGNIVASKTGFTPFSILQHEYISLYIWLDIISNSGSMFLNLFSGTKKFTYPIRILMSGAANEWHHIKVKISEFTTTNGMTKKDLIDKISIQSYGLAGRFTKFRLADVILDNIQSPTISFTFDDNNLTDYTVAYNKMKEYRLTGTCYTISTAVGLSGRTTVAQMKEMYDDGWCFGIHGSDAVDWVSNSTLAEAEVRIKTCRDWLYDNGFIGKGLSSCAYPQGQYNNDVINVLKKLGIKQARSTILQYEYIEIPSKYKLRGKAFSSNFDTNKQYIDDVIKNNGSLCFIIHNLAEQAYTDSFNQTIEYIAQNYKQYVRNIEDIILD